MTGEIPHGYIADTSVFIAAEQGRALSPAPGGTSCLSVATLTELVAGVERAGSGPSRALREETLQRARSFIALPYDEAVAVQLGKILAAARRQGRRAGVMDAIIAATALAHDLAVWTQDDDFDVLAELAPGLRVCR